MVFLSSSQRASFGKEKVSMCGTVVFYALFNVYYWLVVSNMFYFP